MGDSIEHFLHELVILAKHALLFIHACLVICVSPTQHMHVVLCAQMDTCCWVFLDTSLILLKASEFVKKQIQGPLKPLENKCAP